jgi:hypothetical protein
MRCWEAQYKDVRDDLTAVRGRATNLLSATGIISGVVALVVPLATWFVALLRFNNFATSIVGLFTLLLIACLLWSAIAAVYLSVSAQQVAKWTLFDTIPRPENRKAAYEVDYTQSLYVASVEDSKRVDNFVRYLHDAQRYFKILIAALVILVAASIFAQIPGLPTSTPIPTLSPTPHK